MISYMHKEHMKSHHVKWWYHIPYYIYEIMSWFHDVWNHNIEIICMEYDITKPSYMISGMYDIIHAYITYEIISYESILSYPYSIHAIMSWFHDIWNHIIEIICMGYDFTKSSHMISGYLWYHSFNFQVWNHTHEIIVKPMMSCNPAYEIIVMPMIS